MNVDSGNGHIKAEVDPAAAVQAKPVTLHGIESFRQLLSNKGRIDPALVPVAEPQQAKPVSIDTALAAAAHTSIRQVKAARRLLRYGNENLAIAVILQLVPLGAALASTRPPKTSTRREYFRQIIALCS